MSDVITPIELGEQRTAARALEFIEHVLVDPATGKPFVLLDAERWFLKFAFTLDADGRLMFPELVYGAIKKSGKTGFAAIFTITLLLLFGGRYAEAYVAANDLEQAQGRVFEMCRRIVEASPMLRSEAKITANRITFTATGATITAVASDYAGAAGGHPTISVFDELWGYTSERSRRLWDELVPVPTRKVSCRLVVSYAGFEGESELLYELYKRGMAQPLVGKDLHAGDGMLMFWTHEPVAPWQTPAWLAEMRRSLRPNQYLRMIENKFVTTESTFIDMDWWDACTDPALTPVITDSSLPIWVGVDASTKHDSTAIVAVTWDETNQKVRLVASKTFQPSPDAPLDFEMAIEHTLLALHQRFDLRQVLYDPFQMQSSARRLQKERIEIEEFPQTVANLTEASQNLYELIKGRNLVTYPDDAMRLAISRAVAIETSRGWRIAKEKQAHRIDVVVALAMAALCCVKAQSDGDYDITFRWVSEDPPPDDSKAREERVRNLIELLKTGAKVPF
jgi:phage terminase large subunit-like protein